MGYKPRGLAYIHRLAMSTVSLPMLCEMMAFRDAEKAKAEAGKTTFITKSKDGRIIDIETRPSL